MDQLEYKRELELTEKQNFTEFDMYHYILQVIKCYSNVKKYSLRMVACRRKSYKGDIFYGISAFPDIVILDDEFNNADNVNDGLGNLNKMYGCVEVKNINENLLSITKIISDIQNRKYENYCDEKNELEEKIRKKLEKEILNLGEILGEVLWYRNVIYTNGYQWKYLKIELENMNEKEYDKYIKKFAKSTTKDTCWFNSIDFEKIKIHEKVLLENVKDASESDWKKFIEALREIEWSRK